MRQQLNMYHEHDTCEDGFLVTQFEVVTMFAIRNKCIASRNKCHASSNKVRY